MKMYPTVGELKNELSRFNEEVAEQIDQIIDKYLQYTEFCKFKSDGEMCYRHKLPLMILIRGGSVHIDASPEAMAEGDKSSYTYYTTYTSINYLYHIRSTPKETVIRRKPFANYYPTDYSDKEFEELFVYRNHGEPDADDFLAAIAEDPTSLPELETKPSAHLFIRQIADKLTFLSA